MIHRLADVAEQAVDTDRMEWKRWDSRSMKLRTIGLNLGFCRLLSTLRRFDTYFSATKEMRENADFGGHAKH